MPLDKGKDEQVSKLIDNAIKLVEKRQEQFIDPIAEEIILYDLNKLKEFLTN